MLSNAVNYFYPNSELKMETNIAIIKIVAKKKTIIDLMPTKPKTLFPKNIKRT